MHWEVKAATVLTDKIMTLTVGLTVVMPTVAGQKNASATLAVIHLLVVIRLRDNKDVLPAPHVPEAVQPVKM
mgnify:CR=1 FL=1